MRLAILAATLAVGSSGCDVRDVESFLTKAPSEHTLEELTAARLEMAAYYRATCPDWTDEDDDEWFARYGQTAEDRHGWLPGNEAEPDNEVYRYAFWDRLYHDWRLRAKEADAKTHAIPSPSPDPAHPALDSTPGVGYNYGIDGGPFDGPDVIILAEEWDAGVASIFPTSAPRPSPKDEGYVVLLAEGDSPRRTPGWLPAEDTAVDSASPARPVPSGPNVVLTDPLDLLENAWVLLESAPPQSTQRPSPTPPRDPPLPPGWLLAEDKNGRADSKRLSEWNIATNAPPKAHPAPGGEALVSPERDSPTPRPSPTDPWAAELVAASLHETTQALRDVAHQMHRLQRLARFEMSTRISVQDSAQDSAAALLLFVLAMAAATLCCTRRAPPTATVVDATPLQVKVDAV